MKVVFEMDPMPLAGGFADTQEIAKAAEKISLTWVQCSKCELVQVAEDVSDEMLYKNYCYASSSVGALCDHFDAYAELIKGVAEGPKRVLEIGCNDGILLRRLPVEWDLVGVDPSNVAAYAMPGPYELINESFNTRLNLRNFDLVVASNCLAHITDIREVIAAAAQALRPDGQFWIEVHDLEATLKTGQWDTIYHEHKMEYSLASLCRTVGAHGFLLKAITKLPLHGGLLRASFSKTEAAIGVSGASSNSFDLLADSYKNRRSTSLYESLKRKERLVAYGAAGRATVWFNQMSELEFLAVIDDSFLRQGTFVPGVSWPIVPWSDRPEGDILITAWNYADAIRTQHPEYTGAWFQTWEG